MKAASTNSEELRIGVDRRLGRFNFTADVRLPLSGLTAVYGRSGSGKTTLINLVAGLLRPDSGYIALGDSVFFDSTRRIDLPVEQRGLGYVFQDARLFPHLSVRGNLLFGFRRAAPPEEARAISVERVIELLGIATLLDRRPHTLSGGERQRVALGRALLAQPRLLLMDEPLASLDEIRKAEILPYIERLRDELRIPILYVSHAIDEVLRLATALVVLDDGRVVAYGSTDDALEHEAVERVLGDVDVGTLVFGRIIAHDDHYRLSTIDCGRFELHVPRINLPVGAALRARVPARDVALSLTRPSDVSISNRIEGVIDAVTPLHGTNVQVKVRVAPDITLRARITRESTERLGLTAGLPVWCLIKTVALEAATLHVAHGQAAKRASISANDASMGADDSQR